MSDTNASRPSSEDTITPDSNATSPTAVGDEVPALPSERPKKTHHYYHRRSSISEIFHRRKSSRGSERRGSVFLRRTDTSGAKHFWKFTLREWDDDAEQDWWFASTAVPLLAATIGPLANVLSIAALVTYWRMCTVPGATKENAHQCAFDGNTTALVTDLAGQTYRDPKWCIDLNAVSLVAGFVGNFFLLCNFTNRIRYIVALPVTIVMWYIATGILIGLTVSMELYVPPVRPAQIYSQGFWYAIIAACMYMICAMLLMVNMLGYFLGHYPQHFQLTDSQRTLILQTMLFFIWLAGGGAVFSRVEDSYGDGSQNWSFINALYFCDVTILTVGFGDLYPTSDTGRGLVFPYSVGGIIMLGLMVSSITKFAGEIGQDNVIRRHVERSRARTVGRTVTSSLELEHRTTLQEGERPVISAPFPMQQQEQRQTTIQIADNSVEDLKKQRRGGTGLQSLRRVVSMGSQQRPKKTKLLLLREEKDRFDAMRHIQLDTAHFKRWSALFMAVIAFGLLWCVGAVVFWVCEQRIQDMTYFKALYFCYVSLLTIGYGDLAPKSNPGRPFFVFWSLIAVPTMTILVSSLGETVINKFKQGTFRLADFTVLPKEGVWREIIERYPQLFNWLQRKKEEHEAKHRLEEGFQIGPSPEDELPAPTIDELAHEEPSDADLAKRLPRAIRKVAEDMKSNPHKRYTYEEWVEITRLIRFSAQKEEDRETDEDDEGLIEWDWIGENSPMMSRGSEAEFVLARLCESMTRYIKHVCNDAGAAAVSATDSKSRPTQRKDESEGSSLRRRLDDGNGSGDDLGPRNEKALDLEQ
jgi:potassium channel subfamily K, other eukaryote